MRVILSVRAVFLFNWVACKHMQTQSRPFISHQHHTQLHSSNSSASDQHSAIACAVTLAFYSLSLSLSLWMIIRVLTGWPFLTSFLYRHTHTHTHTHTQSAVKQATRYCLFRTSINILFLQICRQDCVSCAVAVGPVALFLSLP